jgi:hypothetical protein
MKTNLADKYFSIFIRLRDSDDNGICRCITCGTPHFWKEMDCGHFVKRQHQGTRFNEKNCASQCKKCNWLLQGNDAVYEKKIIELYGQQTLDLLKSSERATFKRSKMELDLLAKEYKLKAENLAKEKGLKFNK